MSAQQETENLDEAEEFKTLEDEQLFKNALKLPKIESISDTGSSIIKYDYT